MSSSNNKNKNKKNSNYKKAVKNPKTLTGTSMGRTANVKKAPDPSDLNNSIRGMLVVVFCVMIAITLVTYSVFKAVRKIHFVMLAVAAVDLVLLIALAVIDHKAKKRKREKEAAEKEAQAQNQKNKKK